MNTTQSSGVTRRRFLGGGAAAALGAAGVVGGASIRAATPAEENPWRYDIDRLREVDPSRVGYERIASFSLEASGARRLVWRGDDELWVGVGREVRGYDVAGRRLAGFRTADTVRALAFHGDDRVYVGLKDRVEVYDRSGERVAVWAPVSGKPFLTGLAMSGERVLVADSGNRVVYRCDLKGAVELRIGEKHPDRGIPGLVLPSPFLDVEVAADGLLRVNNPGRHRVEAYTMDGDLEQSWGRPGVALEGFCGCCNPVAISVMADGRVVTAEKGLPRVKVYTASGALETVVAGPMAFAPVGSDERLRSQPDTALDGLDVAVAPDGRVAVLDVPGGTVQVFRAKVPSAKGA